MADLEYMAGSGRAGLRRLWITLALVAAVLAQLVPAHAAGTKQPSWDDVGARHWAKAAIDEVGHRNPWMNDFGSSHFKPNAFESRARFAHALVLAFAPGAAIDPKITFKDTAPTDPYFPFANVAVQRHWIPRMSGNFLPEQPVTMTDVHKALVRVLGLWDVAKGIDRFHTTDGYVFKHPKNIGALMVGMLLELRYNHSDESLDVHPADRLPRSEVAWSLARAHEVKTSDTWVISSIRSDGYRNLHVGPVTPEMRSVIEFGLKYIGYPYIYAAEWGTPTPPDYCCGPQVQGGFDCSGLTWWLMKAPSGSYDNTPIRGYRGWNLPQRSSRDMASVGWKVPFDKARAGDLMFYSSAGPKGTINHVDTYLGYGWALDSSDSIGGVTIMHVDDGWYRDHFVHARRLIKN